MTIITRASKGGPLAHAEMDTNFTDLRDGVDLKVPSAPDKGLRVDSLGTPDFGWHDLVGELFVPDPSDPLAPSFATYRGGIKQWRFGVDDEAHVRYHLPHDYLMGSDLYIHVHWSHASTQVTGGTVTWGFELTYAKGHNQQAFGSPITIVEIQNAPIQQYRHMICEAPASILGGSANLLDNSILEVDGLLMGRVFLDSNDITVSGGGVPELFVHYVDIHYRSTGVPTKNRAPTFW